MLYGNLTQNTDTNERFNSELFLQVKCTARKYFFTERMNSMYIPTVIDILQHLRKTYAEKELPTIATVSRWHTSWKRSN